MSEFDPVLNEAEDNVPASETEEAVEPAEVNEETAPAIDSTDAEVLAETITESLFENERAPVEAVTNGEAPASENTSKPNEDSSDSGIHVAMSLCDAVMQAVGKERFHGGVRPDNISVRDGNVYLGSTLKHGVGEFTPQELEYMAPELFWDGVRTPASDVYSVGLVLYSLYNFGRLPFWPVSGAITPNARASALQKRMSDEILTPPANADAELAAVILRALSFQTDDRWKDVTELRDALGKCDASNSPIDISLAMTGLLTRSTENKSAETPAGKGLSYYDEGELDLLRQPERRKSLSWLWIALAVIIAAAALILLFNDNFRLTGASASPTPEVTTAPTIAPTPTPTPEITPTPEPTKRPSGPKYVVYREDLSWGDAVARCEELGGWMAIPANKDELADVVRLCNNEGLDYAWLGAARQQDGSWMTSRGETVSYFNWSAGEPSMTDAGDGAAEDYLLLWKMGEDEWLYNDSREDLMADYAYIYSGRIGFVCQMWE